jgi:hypothetical protein
MDAGQFGRSGRAGGEGRSGGAGREEYTGRRGQQKLPSHQLNTTSSPFWN